MDRVKRSRMANFYARLNRGQLENSLFYCVNVCVLRRSERALKRNNFSFFKMGNLKTNFMTKIILVLCPSSETFAPSRLWKGTNQGASVSSKSLCAGISLTTSRLVSVFKELKWKDGLCQDLTKPWDKISYSFGR